MFFKELFKSWNEPIWKYSSPIDVAKVENDKNKKELSLYSHALKVLKEARKSGVPAVAIPVNPKHVDFVMGKMSELGVKCEKTNVVNITVLTLYC